MIKSVARLVFVACASVLATWVVLNFRNIDISIGLPYAVTESVRIGLVVVVLFTVTWWSLATLLQLFVSMSLISVDRAGRIVRAVLWIASPLVVHQATTNHAIASSNGAQGSVNTKPHQPDVSNLMTATFSVAAVRAAIEVIDSRRRHILRTEHLIGQSVQPRPEDVFIESQLRRAGQLSTIGEITTYELNESLIGKAEQLEVMRLVKVDPAVLETKVQFEPTFLVRLMGPVEVVDLAGNVVAFNRAKSVELLAWITQHRSAPRRSLARSAMWDAGVQDATFHNVVSEVRRGLNAASQEESHWISRSHDDHLELNDNVQSDSELLREALNVCRSSSTSDNLLGLRQALSLVRGLPFAGTNYLWPDTEGITSNIVIMILEAAELLAENALEAREISDVFWATGQGLRVVQGHEGLVALRMRAHAVNHSKAGVESEWRSYLRAVQADSWSSGKPNPVLVDLHQSLLSS